MESAMDKWYDAIKKRVSVRKYTEGVGRGELKTLRDAARYFSTENVRIIVGKKEGVFNTLLGKTISGTDTFAAVVSRGDDVDYMVGTVGEAFVLECVSMGLGTCWLGLSYNKSVVHSMIHIDENEEKLRAVIAIGHYDKLPEKKRSRKTIYNLTGIEEDAFGDLPEWQRCAIECARIAPSARNAQPWEFDVLKDSLQVACISKNFGYGGLDCGIAMLHIEVGAAHCGIYGDWQVEDRLPLFTIDYSLDT